MYQQENSSFQRVMPSSPLQMAHVTTHLAPPSVSSSCTMPDLSTRACRMLSTSSTFHTLSHFFSSSSSSGDFWDILLLGMAGGG